MTYDWWFMGLHETFWKTALVFWIIFGLCNCFACVLKGYKGIPGFILGFLFGIFALTYTLTLDNVETTNKIKSLEEENNDLRYQLSMKKIIDRKEDNECIDDEKEDIKEIEVDFNEEETVKPVFVKEDRVVCPECGQEQPANRKCCWKCGRKFIQGDEKSE